MKHTLPRQIKYWFFICLLLGGLLPVKGQYVTIPDAAFVSWLNNNGYSTCLNGNRLDTTCDKVLNAQSLNCYAVPIRDLTGLQYFKNIDSLDCSNDSLYFIPSFPDSLQVINCRLNNLDSLPGLPASLQELFCEYNRLLLLPDLPSNLYRIRCNYNLIRSLPALPASLRYLECESNQLSSIPPIPINLVELDCNINFITTLPSLQQTFLQQLEFAYNEVRTAPALPASLYQVQADGNPLYSLPELPANLKFLSCSSDSLDSLPALPATLIEISCGNNNLTKLPALPQALQYLQCQYNQIRYFDYFPKTLVALAADDNYLTALPELPDSLYYIYCNNNSGLTCLPQLKRIVTLNFSNTAVTCVPDYGSVTSSTPALDTMPLCGIFNGENCEPFWNISGKCYYDVNSNCLFDSTDVRQNYIKVLLDSGGVTAQQVFTGGQGYYSFKLNNTGTYTVSTDTANLPFRLLCPGNGFWKDTIGIGRQFSYDNDFSFKCRETGFDLGVYSILNTGIPRPAAVFTLNTIAGDISQLYGAHCADGIGGQVTITFSGPISYAGPAYGALTPVLNGNTLTYNIADYGATDDFSAFNTAYQISSSAQAGQLLCFTVNITPLARDYNPSNNTATYCFPVVNALDPNEKEVYPTTVDSANEWLTYTVRFQNTGTAPAVNIIVKDTLNNNLDPASFQLLAYSAQNVTQVFGNVVVFNFPNINLADSATSDSLSRGFVQYRVKTISNMQQNAVITNTASIYFDNNPAIATNTVTDTVAAQTCTPNDTTLNQSICSGDSVLFNGTYYNATGTYSETLTNVGGCDSVVNLNLNVLQSLPFTFLYDTICNGDSLLFNNIYYNQAGRDTVKLSSVNGCDSTVILNLTINNALASPCAHYYPMLDSVNIWHYSQDFLGALPPPHNPYGIGLRDVCGYPVWHQSYGEEYTFGDTIINALRYQVLWNININYNNYGCIIGYIREDTLLQKLYFKDVSGNPDITLYDYSLLPGEHFIQGRILYNDSTNFSSYRLDSITTVQIAAGARRKFYFSCDTCGAYNNISAFSWIEGVGNLADMVFPYTQVSYGGGPFSPCGYNLGATPFPYNMNQIVTCFLHYNSVYFDSCAYALALQGAVVIDSCTYYLEGGGIHPITSLNSFSIYPNPASNQITLSFDVNQSDALDITLLDATGRQVLPTMNTGQLLVGTQTREMNIEGLASGFYLVACKNASGGIYRKLIVREE